MKSFVFWWDSPCKGMIGVMKYFCENISVSSRAITGNLGPFRTAMGWDEKEKYFDNHTVVLKDENWEKETLKLICQFDEGFLHIFGGSTHGRCKHLVKYASTNHLSYCIMTEAPFNKEFGLKALAKFLYINLYLPIITRGIAVNSSRVFCLSGNKEKDLNKLRWLGYPKDKIIPFGYWTEETKSNTDYLKVKNPNEKILLVCPGLLEPYKGVNVLIKAIHRLVKSGYENFFCVITGKGSQENNLKQLSKRLGVERFIKFEGVLNQEKFDVLMETADILVAPGYSEPWGIRVNESIQRNQVVICSDGLGASDLIKESGGGIVVKAGSVNDLSNAIKCFLDDYSKITAMSKNNHDYKEKISCSVKAEELFNHLLLIK